MKVFKYVFPLLSISMLVSGVLLYLNTSLFLSGAIKTEGTVVKLLSYRVSNDTTYQAVIDFVDRDGKTIEFSTSGLNNPGRYSKGSKVEVLYSPTEPQNAKINTFDSLWGISLVLGVMGGVLFLQMLAAVLYGRKKDRQITGVNKSSRIQTIELNQPRLKSGAFDDPLSSKISWGPVAKERSGLYDLTLKYSQGKMVAAYTKKAVVSAYKYTIIGALLMLIGLLGFFFGWVAGIVLLVVFGGIGALLVWAGVGYISKKKLFYFDKSRGIFYSRETCETTRLVEVHALQVVSEYVRNMYDLPQAQFHELNLVLKDGTRLNVMKKYRREDIETAAAMLGDYLMVPVWLAVEQSQGNQMKATVKQRPVNQLNSDNVVTVRAEVTDDPIANKVSWKPVKRLIRLNGVASSSFKVAISNFTLRIKKSVWVPGMVAVAVGFGIFLFSLIYKLLGGTNGYAILGIVIGGFFALTNSGALRKREIAAFDKGNGMFWLGRERRKSSINFEKRMLSAIHALQITDILLPDAPNMYVYELNIVFRDATRENIFQSLKLDETKQNAEALADFLNIPVLQVST